MSEFVRVRNANGYESTLSADYVAGLEKGAVEILDDVPATNSVGMPLKATRRDGRPAKPRTTVKKAAAKKAAAKKTAAKKTAAPPAPTTTPSGGDPAGNA